MNGPRIGSWCTGYGGLDMAVQSVFGGELAWVSDVDEGANKIIAHRMPGIPNLGDLTTTDWHQVLDTFGRPDITLGGYPCQPFSLAGKRKGTEDERHIWPYIADALGVLRPRVAVFENVSGHLRLGFDTVLADLARLGFDVEWACVRASEVGAPHQRNRLFIVATAQDAHSSARDQRRIAAPGQAESRWARADFGGRGGAPAAHPGGSGLEVGRVEPDGQERQAAERGGREPAPDADSGRLARHQELNLGTVEPGQQAPRGDDAGRLGVQRGPAADTEGLGRGEGRPEPAGQQGRLGPASGGSPDWGRFGPAVARWEAITGRRAPWATDDRNRLSPAFVEWLMGLPAGHVTDVPGLNRNAQLKALGNGVVPHQAEAAIRLLHARAARPALTPAA